MSEERFTPASRLAAMDVGSTWTANGVSVTRSTLERWTIRDTTDSGYYASTIDADHAALVAFAVAERIAAKAEQRQKNAGIGPHQREATEDELNAHLAAMVKASISKQTERETDD